MCHSVCVGVLCAHLCLNKTALVYTLHNHLCITSHSSDFVNIRMCVRVCEHMRETYVCVGEMYFSTFVYFLVCVYACVRVCV